MRNIDETIGNIIILAIFRIKEKKESINFERLLKECFELSPDSICLTGYPQWPDSRKLDRPLRLLREKGLVSGDPRTAFDFTEEGTKQADKIIYAFRQGTLDL